MDMLRNREFRQFVICYLLITSVNVILGFAIHRAAGILAACSSMVFGIAFCVFTRARYRSIAQIADQIDLVLHNADHLYISDSEEGELSILQSEIVKMTLRIREQNAMLKKEKEHLADSLADIAHQLRTPLTSINLILSLLENDPDGNERDNLLWEAEELLARMDWLLTALLKLSRLDAGIVEFRNDQVDVKCMLDAALKPLSITMELHGISLGTEIPEGLVIAGDSDWLSEAVRNILKNCVESVGGNGRIEIVCEDNLLYTEIVIRDNGAGFKEEDLYYLFDRFYRGKNSDTAGFGIGLALCRTIITRQGGTVSAGNHPQGGAMFCIRFPK